jgi:hypothetical protein
VSERGVTGWRVLGGPVAAFWAARKKKEKIQVGWAVKEKWVRVICFVFFQFLLFPFQAFTQKLFQKF